MTDIHETCKTGMFFMEHMANMTNQWTCCLTFWGQREQRRLIVAKKWQPTKKHINHIIKNRFTTKKQTDWKNHQRKKTKINLNLDFSKFVCFFVFLCFFVFGFLVCFFCLLRVCFFCVFCVKPCSYILCAVGLLSLARLMMTLTWRYTSKNMDGSHICGKRGI